MSSKNKARKSDDRVNLKENLLRMLISLASLISIVLLLLWAATAYCNPPSPKAKFYDFSEQIINGEVRKPRTFYVDIRDKIKFERLLSLKKSFMRRMYETSKEPVFK
jgi:hypothetical protein